MTVSMGTVASVESHFAKASGIERPSSAVSSWCSEAERQGCSAEAWCRALRARKKGCGNLRAGF